jgi:hypothetical protein
MGRSTDLDHARISIRPKAPATPPFVVQQGLRQNGPACAGLRCAVQSRTTPDKPRMAA